MEKQGCAETIKSQLGVCSVSGSHWDFIDPRLVSVERGG